jgi:diguanylate cyclase (GGDEF)-like protein
VEIGSKNLLDGIAETSGLAVVILDEAGRELSASNNNSICSQLYTSVEFGPQCAEFCGKALSRSIEAGQTIEYCCHAGLDCRAATTLKKEGRALVTIIGRTFSKADNYMLATERAIAGDWQQFSPATIFENVIFSSSPNQLEKLELQISELDKDLFRDFAKNAKAVPAKDTVKTLPPVANDRMMPDPFESSLLNYRLESSSASEEARTDPFESSMINFKMESSQTSTQHDMTDREAWRSFIPSLLKVSYKLACRRILEFLSRQYSIESSLWLQREGVEFETAAVYGEFEDKPVRIDISVDDKRIRTATRDDSPIVLKELQNGTTKKARLIQLFPVVIGGEVRNALGIAGENMDPELSGRILKFCRYVASRLEILRLREAVADRERLSQMLKEFNEQLRNIDAENFWQQLTSVSARLVGAERASLLIRGPAENLTAKASIGAVEDFTFAPDLGSRVARTILEKGKPVLVMDTAKISLSPAPTERKYKSASFISYPITLGEQGIAVMNFTDKGSGERFDKRDLETLDSIAPQIAIVIDRMALRDKAGEYAQLSITDPLTGLLNRRYIEERLTEEVNRSERTGDPISFLMLDVDQFKSYNDRFGHPAGDEALHLIGVILKENLRGADVAARYGGEEFSILLPETAVEEAETIAERIRNHVEQTEFPKRKVTISIGIAGRSEEASSVRDLISAADKALYQAKQKGRNNVQIYRPAADAGDNVH